MKKYKTIISMMSGTSLDGADACLCRIFDDLSFEILNDYSLDYPKEIKDKLFDLANNRGDVKDVCFMNFVLGEFYAKVVCELIKRSGIKKEDVDFISSHGQTIFHAPQAREIGGIKTGSTLQIGDISVIAEKTGIMTVGDFRTKDIAAGGQGAPLVPFADRILFPAGKNRLIQNIGGISNVTVLSDTCEIFAFDNAPGNMLIDFCARKLFNESFDKDGAFAAKGKVNENLLEEYMKEPYFSVEPPKSTGRELFNDNYALNLINMSKGNNYDTIATITALTAEAISESYKKFIFPKTDIDEVVLGGGGAYNKTLIKYLSDRLPGITIKTHADYGIPDKLKEALAFAYLGYYTVNKRPNNVPSCTGAREEAVGGKIAY